MFIKQISIFLENKAGSLSELMETIGSADVNLLALVVADTKDFGIIRVIVRSDDIDKMLDVLRDSGHVGLVNNVICIRTSHKPGAFGKAMKVLKGDDCSIEYAYSFCRSTGADAVLIVRPANLDMAVKTLIENGIALVSQEEVDAF